MAFYSPLRYPGGKSSFTNLFLKIFESNSLSVNTYFEIYAGGAAAAFDLLLNNHVSKIVLNDADYHIFALWNSIIHNTESFLKKLIDTPITLNEWHKQKLIYDSENKSNMLEIGFATFFLNRTNRSGILLNAGPIGGKSQNGLYKLDVRFNKSNLSERIKNIAKFEHQIIIYNEDAINLIKILINDLKKDDSFLFLDPPYYNEGSKLYLNHYIHDDHVQLRNFLFENQNFNWLMSYDNVNPIKELYSNFFNCLVDINYSLQLKKKEKEIVILSNKLHFNTQSI